MTSQPFLTAAHRQSEANWLFAVSFRPLFLGASIFAALAVPVWVHFYVTGAGDIAGMPALAWHAHEMVFGYLPAVMAGYLLSATPNWSGRLPASGGPLALLFTLWLAGRTVPLAVPLPLWAGAAVDAAFPLAVALALMREARVKVPQASRHGLILFPLLATASIAHRLLAADPLLAAQLARLGVAIGALLIAAVGGRLVPSFTRNALAGRGADKVPEPYGRFDRFCLLVASAALISWVLAPSHSATAFLALAAGLLHLFRLARWRGWLLRQGDVLALHAGYLWLVLALFLAGLAAEPLALVPPEAALHAFAAGAIGTMTMAVMARLAATRGPGPRAEAALCAAALVITHLAATARVAAVLLPSLYIPLLLTSAALWAVGFAVFALAQLPGPASPVGGQKRG
ncbi:NnrS family protein [Afifella pfennigii]|uniref:NnrS family protein n=1 Tax=Afifella pfennigii TaxID=209897 RepID=UPI0006911F91|nr:NnrS family protein [Afifella pfennigii]